MTAWWYWLVFALVLFYVLLLGWLWLAYDDEPVDEAEYEEWLRQSGRQT